MTKSCLRRPVKAMNAWVIIRVLYEVTGSLFKTWTGNSCLCVVRGRFSMFLNLDLFSQMLNHEQYIIWRFWSQLKGAGSGFKWAVKYLKVSRHVQRAQFSYQLIKQSVYMYKINRLTIEQMAKLNESANNHVFGLVSAITYNASFQLHVKCIAQQKTATSQSLMILLMLTKSMAD